MNKLRIYEKSVNKSLLGTIVESIDVVTNFIFGYHRKTSSHAGKWLMMFISRFLIILLGVITIPWFHNLTTDVLKPWQHNSLLDEYITHDKFVICISALLFVIQMGIMVIIDLYTIDFLLGIREKWVRATNNWVKGRLVLTGIFLISGVVGTLFLEYYITSESLDHSEFFNNIAVESVVDKKDLESKLNYLKEKRYNLREDKKSLHTSIIMLEKKHEKLFLIVSTRKRLNYPKDKYIEEEKQAKIARIDADKLRLEQEGYQDKINEIDTSILALNKEKSTNREKRKKRSEASSVFIGVLLLGSLWIGKNFSIDAKENETIRLEKIPSLLKKKANTNLLN